MVDVAAAVGPLRDFTGPADYFICRCDAEPEPKPISSLELYMHGVHVPLPFYNPKRWALIKAALGKIATAGETLTFDEFTNQFNSYLHYQKEPDFTVLADLVNSGWHQGALLSELLPGIARMALELPNQVRQPIRLLRIGQNGSLTLSQRQAACLLANAFFSTFPNRDRRRFNRINFIRLFHRGTPRAEEKVKCLLHYFAEFIRISGGSQASQPLGALSIVRQQFTQPMPNWAELELPLTSLCAMPVGKIEDDGAQMTQLDFANQFIGGGVLGHGLVQEEIRFLICPELLVACLVCEKVEPDEAILMVGADRFSNYSGYDHTFRWEHRKWEMPNQRDSLKRRLGEVLAIDAVMYQHRNFALQFEEKFVRRELLKALAGFSFRTAWSPDQLATGNWGCGAFGGDLHLKSLIQLMAASLVRRPLFYFTFGGRQFAQELDANVRLMKTSGVSIGQLYQLVIRYGKEQVVQPQSLFAWIRQQLVCQGEQGIAPC